MHFTGMTMCTGVTVLQGQAWNHVFYDFGQMNSDHGENCAGSKAGERKQCIVEDFNGKMVVIMADLYGNFS